MSVAGKSVIVTGAARGIGLEYCKALVEGGAQVLATDVSPLDEAAALTGPGRVATLKVDVTSAESTAAMVAEAVRLFGRVDAIINNAALYGALKGGRFTDIDEGEWDRTMAVNVKGIWNCCKAVIGPMREQKSGSIVNIASVGPLYGTPFALHYTASKGAVIALTRGLAREIGRDNIRVNAIAPTAIQTQGTAEFYQGKADKALEGVKAGQAIQRNLVASDVTGTALWLISDASAFVTGQTIVVDGGLVMH